MEPGVYDYLNTTWSLNNAQWKNFEGVNSIDKAQENALSMLDTAVEAKKPFFMAVAPAVPHVGINASSGLTFFPIPQAKWANAFGNHQIPRTPNFNPATQNMGASFVKNLPFLNQTLIDGMDELYRARLRAVAGLDDMVDALITALDDYGILNNTHVVFTTDNGYHIGQHRFGPGKKQGYETDVHIPFFWRGPGIPVNKTSNDVSTHTDLAPTFLSLFGLPLRSKLDGRGIPNILKNGQKSGEHVNIELWGSADIYEVLPFKPLDDTIPGWQNDTYKGLRIIGDSYNVYYSVWCTNEHELYDMVADNYQTTNMLPNTLSITQVSSTQQFLGISLKKAVSRLDAVLMVLKTCVGVQCTQPWAQLHPQGDVSTLKDALNPKFDSFYASQPKVSFTACMQGYLPEYEGESNALVYS